MPKFLENALRHEGRKKGLKGKHLERYVYGGMNNLGAMHGSKETPKGAAMEKKHEMDHMRITPAENGGHVVEHHFKMSTKGKSGAFVEHHEPESHVFGKGEGAQLLSHLKKHLGIGAAASPKTPEGEMEPAAHEPPHAAGAEEEEEGE